MKTIQINTDRTERINAIIEQRQRFGNRIEHDRTNLEACKLALVNLREHHLEFMKCGFDATHVKDLTEINFDVINEIDCILDVLKKLRYRCSRNTINMAVVGYARQGKSRLLQSLTGLNNRVIPDGGEGYCTGTLSKIIPQAELSETVAKVHFYSPNEFKQQILAPYYQSLGLGTKPTVEEFARTPPPGLPEDKKNSEIDKARYGHLRKDYYTNIAKYRHLLESPTIEIAESEITQYVTQDSVDENGNKIFNYLAVKEVEISCSFPYQDIGNISLLDLPGLRDTNLIESKRLIKTLSQEADLILFVRRPEANAVWREADLKLYQIARDALEDFPLTKCSFMILNRSKSGTEGGDNGYRCGKLKAEIKETPIRVAKCIIADFSDSQETFTQVLEPILDYLIENMESIENEYRHICQKKLDRVYQNINIELEKASVAFTKYSDNDLLFEQLFAKFWLNLTSELEHLLSKLKEDIDSLDREFEKKVKSTIQKCRMDTAIPTNCDDITELRHVFGSYNTAYNQCLHQIRTNFFGNFLSLDRTMQLSLENRKKLVVQILKSNLGELVDSENIDFLKTIYNILPDNASNLKIGFSKLYKFDISNAGKITRLLRQSNLEQLQPDNHQFALLNNINSSQEDVNSALKIEEKILSSLQNIYHQAVDNSEITLEKILSEPSTDAYFMVEEFVDRVIRAKGVQLEWRMFLRKECYKVWSEFQQIEQRVQQLQIWRALVERAKEVNGLLMK